MDEQLTGLEEKTRICIIKLSDYEGFGFTISPNKAGMHQVTSVETRSPAEEAGLRPDDLVLKVNDILVLGESYSRLGTLIKNESECGQIKLEVIEPTRCPARLRNACRITTPDASIRSTNVSESLRSLRRALKEPLVTNPHSTASDSFHSYYSGSIKGSRICTLISRADFEGFGFSMAANQRGPHKISQVETNSPADDGGLRVDDLILKVNDVSVVGERYTKTVRLVKNEFERGRIKLEVIAPSKCPPDIKNTSLKSNSHEFRRPNIKNLRDIIDQATSIQSAAFPDLRRETYSLYDQPPTETPEWPICRQTVTQSYSSVLLTEPETDIRLYKGKPSKALLQKSRFKKCSIRILPNQSFGFTFISMTKPKFMVFSVDPNSAAHKANLSTTDVVITMDGINIRRLKMKKVNRMLGDAIKRGQIELLVINIEGYMHYKKSKSKTLFSEWSRLVSDENTDEFSFP